MDLRIMLHQVRVSYHTRSGCKAKSVHLRLACLKFQSPLWHSFYNNVTHYSIGPQVSKSMSGKKAHISYNKSKFFHVKGQGYYLGVLLSWLSSHKSCQNEKGTQYLHLSPIGLCLILHNWVPVD